jgi:hypothetical protein
MVADPNISVNQLALYMNSKAAKKREILHQRKYPDDDFNPGIFHRESRDEISLYLSGGAIDTSGLHSRLKILSQTAAPKVGTQRRINANIDSIERFLEMLDQVDLGVANVSLGHNNPPKLTYYNVKVSVRPDLILHGVDKKGRTLKGAIKLQLSKAGSFDDDMAKTVSAVVQQYLSDYVHNGEEIIHAPYCQVIDIASGKVFPGVKAITQRLKDVAAECQNIAAIWPTI